MSKLKNINFFTDRDVEEDEIQRDIIEFKIDDETTPELWDRSVVFYNDKTSKPWKLILVSPSRFMMAMHNGSNTILNHKYDGKWKELAGIYGTYLFQPVRELMEKEHMTFTHAYNKAKKSN